MTTLLCFITWCILLVLCWPLALVALVLAPVLWLLALPFVILGTVVGATLSLVVALLFLPARIVGRMAR
jgi:hypothetical protein